MLPSQDDINTVLAEASEDVLEDDINTVLAESSEDALEDDINTALAKEHSRTHTMCCEYL